MIQWPHSRVGKREVARTDHYLVVGAVVIFIESHVRTGIVYDDLCKSIGFSLPHLRAIFARCTGQSLARYAMSRRISWAAFEAVHGGDTLSAIAERYGFTNPDTFTRAFRRFTGSTPQSFRRLSPPVGRIRLCSGVYGVSVDPSAWERRSYMSIAGRGQDTDRGAVLYGVPKVYYGAFGGITPYPICLKAVANYLGIELNYEDAIVLCGAAFRLVWDRTAWNGGNVDVMLAFDDHPATVYRSGIEALGREFTLLGRDGTTEVSEPAMYEAPASEDIRDAFITTIRESIDRGIPVIALGIIGPPEACVIAGYRDGGQTLLGWNCFQDRPEFAGSISIDETGYFVTSSWWENRDTVAIMTLGDEAGVPESINAVLKRAIAALSGRQFGKYAKGILAYDAWKAAILDESQFSKDLVIPLKIERLMCQGDAMDCLADGRNSAYKYFNKLAERCPEQPLYRRLAERFAACATAVHGMYEVLGGWERGEVQMAAFMRPEVRARLGELIDECRAADEDALKLMEELAEQLD